MPFPNAEYVRQAVEQQIHNACANMPGDWIATEREFGTDISFHPNVDGTIDVLYCLDDDEQNYRFRIRVELCE